MPSHAAETGPALRRGSEPRPASPSASSPPGLHGSSPGLRPAAPTAPRPCSQPPPAGLGRHPSARSGIMRRHGGAAGQGGHRQLRLAPGGVRDDAAGAQPRAFRGRDCVRLAPAPPLRAPRSSPRSTPLLTPLLPAPHPAPGLRAARPAPAPSRSPRSRRAARAADRPAAPPCPWRPAQPPSPWQRRGRCCSARSLARGS